MVVGKNLKLKISKDTFKKEIKDKIGIEKVCDYYGMVEQTGSIFRNAVMDIYTNPLCEVIQDHKMI